MRITRIHHVTIAVRDVDGARITFEQLFGERASEAVRVPAFGVRSATLPLGESTLELASPVAVDNPVMRFLERRGEGFYNIALEVEDLDAAIEELVALGVRVSEPIEPEPGLRSSFVTMAATHGLSVQLVEVVDAGARRTIGRTSAAPAPAETPRPSIEAPQAALTSTPIGTRKASGEQIQLDGVPRDEQPDASTAATMPGTDEPLDLTPDEWSDVN